jgi:hypothetical protein
MTYNSNDGWLCRASQALGDDPRWVYRHPSTRELSGSCAIAQSDMKVPRKGVDLAPSFWYQLRM